MNWDAIGAMGDLISGVGVVVTLGYLALQVGHARQEAPGNIGQIHPA